MDQYPTWLNATLASDAAEGAGVLPDWIRALQLDSRVVGPAFVALSGKDDNLVIGDVLAAAPPLGSVLVISGHATSRAATIGGLLAKDIQNHGIAAVITEGLVRDSQEIRQFGLPVWCRGTTPMAPGKRGPSVLGGTVIVGGVAVRTGDLIIADDDGVVVWPQENIDDLMAKAEKRLQSDNARMAVLLGTAAQ
jgi:regulator of RNase E activity RraA